MKKHLFFLVSFAFIIVMGCSDDDKADVNFVTAKFNGVEERFTIISVDTVEYDEYTDIVVRATKNNDSSRVITIASEFGVTGSNTIWGFYFQTGDGYYEQDTTFSSNLTSNSAGSYAGVFSGSIVEDTNGSVIVVTNGSFNIKY